MSAETKLERRTLLVARTSPRGTEVVACLETGSARYMHETNVTFEREFPGQVEENRVNPYKVWRAGRTFTTLLHTGANDIHEV